MRINFERFIQSVRRISRNLPPEQLPVESFNDRILTLCQSLERPGMGNIYFNCSASEQTVPQIGGTYLARIIQELIHNAFKHSSAWHVWISPKWEKRLLLIEVEHDGSGFNKMSQL